MILYFEGRKENLICKCHEPHHELLVFGNFNVLGNKWTEDWFRDWVQDPSHCFAEVRLRRGLGRSVSSAAAEATSLVKDTETWKDFFE